MMTVHSLQRRKRPRYRIPNTNKISVLIINRSFIAKHVSNFMFLYRTLKIQNIGTTTHGALCVYYVTGIVSDPYC